MLINENIICISSDPWYGLWRRRHQLMSRFARNNRVLYVEPPRSILTPFSDKKVHGWSLNFRYGLHSENNCLDIYSPLNLFPFGRVPILNRINEFIIRDHFRRVIKKLGINSAILWLNHTPKILFFLEAILQEIDVKLICYDCYDKYTGYVGVLDEDRANIEDLEKRIIKKSDIVFAASTPLQRYLRQYKDEVHLVPNGVGEWAVDSNKHSSILRPNPLAKIKNPIIGYIGYIGYKVDFKILMHIAKVRPEWSIVLVGPIDPVHVNDDVREIRKLPNVHFIGQILPEDIPGYLKEINVCLVPFKSCEFTQYCSCSPNKLYEYLGAGKPIVSVPLEGIDEYAEVIEVASNKEDFVLAIERALAKDNEGLACQRKIIAQNNTWAKRIERISELIDKQIAVKAREKNKR